MHYRLDDLHIDLSGQAVRRGRELLDVKGLSFRLLTFMLAQGARVISFDELIKAVWAPAVVNEETVTQRVRLLRAALGDDGRKPRYIRSIRGQGYQLCSEPRSLGMPGSGRWRSRLSTWAVAATVIALAGAGVALISMSGRVHPPDVFSDETMPLLARADYYAGIGQAENNQRAITMYEQVLADDPDNPSALLGLSFSLSAGVCLFNGSPASAQRAEALAQQVLTQDESSARAHAALAYSLDCRGFIDAAIAAYERAAALDPGGRLDSAASAAHLYAVKGHLADALRLNVYTWPARDELRFVGLQLARSLELLGFQTAAEHRYAEEFRLYPDNVFSTIAYPRHLFTQGRLKETEAVLATALQRPMRPELLILAGELHLLSGEREAARARFLQAAEMREHTSLPHTLAGIYGETPPEPAWYAARIRLLETAIENGDLWPENWLELALLHWHRGDTAEAVAALDAAVDHGYRDIGYLRASPLFNVMNHAPGFADVLDRIAHAVAGERDKVLAADWLPAELTSARR